MSPGRRFVPGVRGTLLGMAVVLVGSALAALAAVSLRPEAPIPTHRVEPGPFERRVRADGVLRAVRATPVTVPTALRRSLGVAWLVDDGSPVDAGDLVAVLDRAELEGRLLTGREDLTAAEVRTEAAETGRLATLERLSRELEIARLELEHALEFQARDEDLYSRFELIESEIDRQLAELRLDQAGRLRGVHEQLSDAELELLAVDRRRALLMIRQAEEGLAAIELRAPHGGIVALERNWQGEPVRVGDSAFPGRKLAELPDLSRMEVEVFVLEADGGGLAVGQPAEVTLKAVPDRVFRGEVTRVDALARPRLRWLPVQYFAATVSLEETDPAIMKPGQRVEAVLTLDRLEDALTVPRHAVLERDEERLVYRRRRGGFEAVPVTLGPASAGWVVVTSGLEAGDVVALGEPQNRSLAATGAVP